MVDIALSGLMSAGEIAQLQHRQDVMDSHASDMNDQSGHYMAVPGQDPQQARQNADNLIMSNIGQAIQGTDSSGNMSSSALDHLGDAIHTLEDMTSPMHTTDDGTPKTWEGLGFMGHKGLAHFLGESSPADDWSRFGWAIRVTLAAYIQADPVGAAKHGLNTDNFEKEADRRTSQFIQQFYQMRDDPVGEDAARQCALGNPAAYNH
jgi:hypothetical protein